MNVSFQSVLLAAACLLTGCSEKAGAKLVVYTSQDQVYAEPILREFGRATGINVAAIYDSEAVKTVGLANRLLAERNNPQCDVFWNNEEFRTHQLAKQNVFRETNGWRAFGFRSRRIVINTNHLALTSAPRGLSELTNLAWRGKIALAYPLFGTTATHFLALRQHWGDVKWKTWCQGLRANEPFLVDGNSVVVKQVGRGEAWIGLTDSDDVAAGQREGMPILSVPMSEEMLLIPNTVAVIRAAPHPEAAETLYAYLQGSDVVNKLIRANALEGSSSTEVNLATLQPNWNQLVENLESGTSALKEIFLR